MNTRKALTLILSGMLTMFLAGNANAKQNNPPTPAWTEYTTPGSSILVTWINGNSTGSSTVTYSPTAANIWSYDDNIQDQSSGNILSVIDTQFKLSPTLLHSAGSCDNNCTDTFTSTTSFDYLAVHYGQGELLFQFSAPIKSFSISGLHNGLSNYRAYTNLLSVTSISAVPEPETYGMLLAGLGLMGFMVRHKKNS